MSSPENPFKKGVQKKPDQYGTTTPDNKAQQDAVRYEKELRFPWNIAGVMNRSPEAGALSKRYNLTRPTEDNALYGMGDDVISITAQPVDSDLQNLDINGIAFSARETARSLSSRLGRLLKREDSEKTAVLMSDIASDILSMLSQFTIVLSTTQPEYELLRNGMKRNITQALDTIETQRASYANAQRVFPFPDLLPEQTKESGLDLERQLRQLFSSSENIPHTMDLLILEKWKKSLIESEKAIRSWSCYYPTASDSFTLHSQKGRQITELRQLIQQKFKIYQQELAQVIRELQLPSEKPTTALSKHLTARAKSCAAFIKNDFNELENIANKYPSEVKELTLTSFRLLYREVKTRFRSIAEVESNQDNLLNLLDSVLSFIMFYELSFFLLNTSLFTDIRKRKIQQEIGDCIGSVNEPRVLSFVQSHLAEHEPELYAYFLTACEELQKLAIFRKPPPEL